MDEMRRKIWEFSGETPDGNGRVWYFTGEEYEKTDRI